MNNTDKRQIRYAPYQEGVSSGSQKHRRKYRELPEEVKQRISKTTKGKPKTAQHRQHISQAMLKYWRNVPHRPQDGEASGSVDF